MMASNKYVNSNFIIIFAVFCSIITCGVLGCNVAAAAVQSENISASEGNTNNGSSDVLKRALDRLENISKQNAGDEEKKVENRYKLLFKDDSFSYYMDTRNAHWVANGQSAKDDIIEVWIRLVENTESQTNPSKYYLEHYYISPSMRMIQFICELEVSGRPDNNIDQRAFSNDNWESLIPGSLEDDLFDAVTREMKNVNHRTHNYGNSNSMGEVGDFLGVYY